MTDVLDRLRADNTAIIHAFAANRQTLANLLTAFSFGFGAMLLGVPAWKAAVVFVFAFIYCTGGLHRTHIRTAGIIFLAIALGCWTELLPPLREWR